MDGPFGNLNFLRQVIAVCVGGIVLLAAALTAFLVRLPRPHNHRKTFGAFLAVGLLVGLAAYVLALAAGEYLKQIQV